MKEHVDRPIYSTKNDEDNGSGTCVTLPSNDAQIPPHKVLRNLKYDDPEAIISAKQHINQETGHHRVKELFSVGENSAYSPEVLSIGIVTAGVAVLSFGFGTVFSAQHFKDEFVRKNKLAKFDNRMRATRQMNDEVIVLSSLEGLKIARRLTFFTASFLGVSQLISSYRNKSSLMEYGVAGVVTGALMKFDMGLRGMFAGGVIAGTLGMVAGSIIYGTLWLLDETQEKRHFRNIYTRKLQQLHNNRLIQNPPP